MNEPSYKELKNKYTEDDDVLGLAISYGKLFLKKGATDVAKYFLSIAYDLTEDEEILKAIEKLPQETQE